MQADLPSRLRVTTLPNGVRVITEEIPSYETTALGLWVGAGSRDEDDDACGVAHLLEHMAFKGADRRSGLGIIRSIESSGGRVNAHTSREQTAFYANVVRQDAGKAVRSFARALSDFSFDDADFSTEKSVVMREIARSSETLTDCAIDLLHMTAFPQQPLGRPILGHKSDVEKLAPEDLRRFVAARYLGSSTVAIAVGGIDHESFVEEVQANFHPPGLPSGDGSKDQRLPAIYGGGVCHLPFAHEQAHFQIAWPGFSSTHESFYPMQLLSLILGGGKSSRLNQSLKERDALAYQVIANTRNYRDGGLFVVSLLTEFEISSEVIEQLKAEILEAARSLDIKELQRSRAHLKSWMMTRLETSEIRAESLAQQFLVHRRPVSARELIEKLESVGVQDIRDLIGSMFDQPVTAISVGSGDPAAFFKSVAQNFNLRRA